jgi:hypothetical protein
MPLEKPWDKDEDPDKAVEEKVPLNNELPNTLKEEAKQALGYLKELAGEFPKIPEMQEHLEWLIKYCETLGVDVKSLPETQIRKKEADAEFPVVTPLHLFTMNLDKYIRHNEINTPELNGLLKVLRQALDLRKEALNI